MGATTAGQTQVQWAECPLDPWSGLIGAADPFTTSLCFGALGRTLIVEGTKEKTKSTSLWDRWENEV